MERQIIRDPLILARKSTEAGDEDVQTGRDLLDTLLVHRETCVGMAANMIGINKRIIVFINERTPMLMFNPVIVRQTGQYTAEEGCLSLPGVRQAVRADKISVRFQDERFRFRTLTFHGFTAQIIQHEIDHCNGILI